MNKLLVLALIVYCSSLSLNAQADLFYPFQQIPDSLLAHANEVVREESTIFRVESLRVGSLTYRKIVTILNDASTAQQEAVFYDKDSKVRSFQAKLYDGLGKLIRKIDKEEIKDYSAIADFSVYQDDRVQVVDIQHSQYPYTVEIEYEVRLAGARFCNYPNWQIQGFGTAVEKGQLVLDLPQDMKFHHQVLNIALTPEKAQEKGRDLYTWQVANLKARRSESYMPSAMQILPFVITAPDDFQWNKYRGSMASWKDYGQFMAELFTDRDKLPQTAAKNVHQLVASTDDTNEKVRLLYRYLQENMRYVSVQLGIGGWQPFSASYVDEKRYGDCKALSNYMKAMLNEAGIEAYPALIYNGKLSYEVQEDFTTPRFNHMILYVPEEEMWLECTSTSFPPGYIGQSNSNRNALLITDDGGHLLKTPLYNVDDNVEAHQAQIELQADGKALLKVNSHYSGADHETYRSLKTQLSPEDQKKWLLKNQDKAGFHLEDYTLNCAADRPESHLQYSASVAHFAQKAGKRLFVPIKAITPTVSIPPQNKNRLYPIHIQCNYSERDTLIMRFPDGYQVESAPKSHEACETSFGQFQYQLEVGEKQLTYIRTLTIQAEQLQPEQYQDYRNFFKAVAKADGAQVVLKKVE